MGIKRKASATYIADTGKEFETTEMSDSHLLNTIGHHLKQLETLEFIERYVTPPHHLKKRRQALEETIQILTEELATRDPETEEQRRGEIVNRNSKKWEY